MVKKIVGIVLLVSGLIIIFWGLYTSFNIFTAKTEVPNIFKFDNKQVVVQSSGDQSQVNSLIQNQIKSIVPQDAVPKLLNLLAWSIFAGIVTFAGSQIAGIGTKLMA